MDDIMKRISKVCKVKDIRQKDLQINGGGTRQTISAIFNERQKPNVDIIKALLFLESDLNARWLLTGEGEMFIDSHDTAINEPAVEYIKKESDSEHYSMIMLYITTIEKKDSKIEKLYKELSEKFEEIGSLKEQVKGLSSDVDKDEKKGKRVAG